MDLASLSYVIRYDESKTASHVKKHLLNVLPMTYPTELFESSKTKDVIFRYSTVVVFLPRKALSEAYGSKIPLGRSELVSINHDHGEQGGRTETFERSIQIMESRACLPVRFIDC